MLKIPKDAVRLPGERLDYDWCDPVEGRFRLRTLRFEEGRTYAVTDSWGKIVHIWWEWLPDTADDDAAHAACDWRTGTYRRAGGLGHWHYRATLDGTVIARWWEPEGEKCAVSFIERRARRRWRRIYFGERRRRQGEVEGAQLLKRDTGLLASDQPGERGTAKWAAVLCWAGNTIGVLCALAIVVNLVNHGPADVVVLFAMVGVPAFLAAQALRFLSRGPTP